MFKFIFLLIFFVFSTLAFAQTKTATGTSCNQYFKAGSTYTFVGSDGVVAKATIARLDSNGKVILKTKTGTVPVTISKCNQGGRYPGWWSELIEKLRDYFNF
jgi:hypothetical protein